jgi:hypothetical protein
MELIIQLENGVPVNHPIFVDNFREAFPDVDTNNLPTEFAKFVRVEPPILGAYEVYEGVTYETAGDAFTDVHHVRQMTDAEKTEKQNIIKEKWAEFGFASWVFNENTCNFVPPIPVPNDGKNYRWDEPTISWVEVPATQE